MTTMQVVIFIVLICLLGFYLLKISLNAAALIMKKDVSPRKILFNFKEKMWMTAGLGLFFFGSYLIILVTLSLFKHEMAGLDIFYFCYHNPTFCIYLSLGIFVLFSALIYTIRRLIIFLHNSML